MAAFEKRGQHWRAEIRRKGYSEQTRSFDLKSQAEAWARSIENEMDKGTFVDRTETEKNTLGDLIDRYLKEVTPLKRGKETEASRLQALRQRPLAALKMSALSSKHIAQYRDERLRGGVAAGTINKELNHLAHVIETGRREWGIQLPENPVRMVRRPAAPKARDRRFGKGEEAQASVGLRRRT